ncbi:MAG: NAD(P)H-hydrate dehydratase [Desulfosudaceae bacterium]
MYLVTAEQMRQIDQTTIESFGIPGRVLMENAGRGATRWLMENFPEATDQKIAILAGRGNNGGDGFVMARYLFQAGTRVTVYLLSTPDKVSGDAAANLALLDKLGVPVVCLPDEAALESHRSALAHHHLVVDAILGTGLKKEVRGFFKTVINHINDSGQPVFAVDIPSGLNADTGQPGGVCVKARATATFGYAKTGQFQFPGADLCGALGVIDIGIPPFIAESIKPAGNLLTGRLVAGYCQPRPAAAHKGGNGHVLVIAGSPGKTGAAVLTATAAMRAGAGLVTLAVPAGLHHLVAPAVTEIMTLPVGDATCRKFDATCSTAIGEILPRLSCLALGPGLGTDEATQELLRRLLTSCPVPLVIDADGLNCLADRPDLFKKAAAPVVITPHPGEMARLLQTDAALVQADRLGHARSFAEAHNIHVVLKGAGTVIAHPDGTIFVNQTGNPGMAAGGMGDVLTGMIAAWIGQGQSPGRAARLGVYLHGAAADMAAEQIGGPGFLATEVMAALPRALTALNQKNASNDCACYLF